MDEGDCGGVAKVVLERAETDPNAIDHEFLQRHTTGFDAYRSLVAGTGWPEIVHQSGVQEAKIRELADVYLGADRTSFMKPGVTMQEHGVDSSRVRESLSTRRLSPATEPAHPRCAATATSMATAPAVSITGTPKRFLDRRRMFGLLHRAERTGAIADHSEQSGQPLTKHLIVEVRPAAAGPET